MVAGSGGQSLPDNKASKERIAQRTNVQERHRLIFLGCDAHLTRRGRRRSHGEGLFEIRQVERKHLNRELGPDGLANFSRMKFLPKERLGRMTSISVASQRRLWQKS